MLFALAIPFLEVILHSAMAWIRQKYELEKTKEAVDISNQKNEIYRKRTRTPTARSGGKVGRSKNVVKHLIKEAIEEAVTAAAAIRNRDDKDQLGEIEIDTKEPTRPITMKIAWDQKDEKPWPKRVLRYFINYFQVKFGYKSFFIMIA